MTVRKVQESMIERYLERGDMFALYDSDTLRTVCVVTQKNNTTVEIKNIATAPHSQGKGYGKALIAHLEQYYAQNFSTLIVGIGDSPSTTVFYEKCGFVRSGVVKNFFVDKYDHLIFENGIQLVDMIYFSKKIRP